MMVLVEQRGAEIMLVETLSGSIVTPTAIGDVRRVAADGRLYYLGNAGELVVLFPAAKAWRIREYLRGVANGS